MVRVNLIAPACLSDQHLIAEYNEILMLGSYMERYPLNENSRKNIPEKFCLGKGHMRFFSDKAGFLEKRHALLKKEMLRRGFKARKTLKIKLPRGYRSTGYTPSEEDIKIIKERIRHKLKLKPGFYRYEREKKNTGFFCRLLEKY